jgi:hypothetical protein
MMRKLAVTVFAMSLTLIGCGSSSTSKKDAAGDAAKDTVVVSPDTSPKIPDTGVLDTKVADTAVADVSIADTAPKADVLGDTTPVVTTDARDGSTADRVGDTFVKVDTNTTPDTNVVTIPDAPADTAPVSGDAGLEAGVDAQVD